MFFDGFMKMKSVILFLNSLKERFDYWKSFYFSNNHEQKTFLYCECGNELISSNSFISDTYDEKGDNHVLYKCSNCGLKSDWNFDIAPVVINWNKLRNL